MLIIPSAAREGSSISSNGIKLVVRKVSQDYGTVVTSPPIFQPLVMWACTGGVRRHDSTPQEKRLVCNASGRQVSSVFETVFGSTFAQGLPRFVRDL